MASPFNVFRKNQRVLMALLVGFSMIAFIAADVITPQNFPIFVGALLGALALWLLSGRGGAEGWMIAAVGGVLGAVVGVYGPTLFRDSAAVYTDRGSLSPQDIEDITLRQNQANQFLNMAVSAVMAKAPKDKPLPISEPTYFRFTDVYDQASARQNAVLTYLFEQEAEEMGIQIDDRDITRYIVDVTGGMLSDADLRRIRNDLQVGTGELIEILREQIKARDAFNLLYPRTGPTPQALWTDFAKLNNEAEATVATIPAEAFVEQISDPGDDELTRFFSQYRALPPAADGTPGFLVPRQVQVAYVEIALNDIKKRVKAPTDAEVRDYYEKNRAQFEFSNDQPGAEGSSATEDPATTPEDPAAKNEPAGEEAAASPEGSTESATPAEPAAEDSAAPAEPATPESSTAPPDSTTEEAGNSEPAEDSPAAPETGEPEPAEPEPAEPEPAEPAPNADQAAVARDGIEFVAFQQEETAPANEGDAPAADEPAPSEPIPAEAAPADPEPSDPASTDPAPAEPAPTDPAPADPAPANPAPAETDPPALPAPGAAESEPAPAAEPTPEVLDSIRQQLINQRARDMADAELEKVRADIDRIVEEQMDAVPLPEDRSDAKQQATYERQRREATQRVVEQVKAYAAKNGLNFQTTPFLSGEEFYESDDYSIGKAIRWEKNAPPFGRNTTSLVEAIFTTTPEQPLTTIPAQSVLNESRYVALKIADAPPRPADLAEKGVRERVVQAWKLREARQLAKDRAEQLAAAAKKAGGLSQAAQEATVTGKAGGSALKTEKVGPFTWLRRSTAPRTDFAPPEILPSELPKLPEAGEEFMETVFAELKVGETGVAPAVDQSKFYVVQVENKNLEDNLADVREKFLQEDFFRSPLDQYFQQPMNPYRRRNLTEEYKAQAEWFKKFRERHGVVEDVVSLEE